MTPDAWAAIGITICVFILLATTRIVPYLVLGGGVTVLLVTGVLPTQEALAGFANEGVITVAALFVLVAGLERTGAIARLISRFLGRPHSDLSAQARLTIPVAAGSALLNNTPVVAMLIPVVTDWARQIRVSPTKLLLPLSYAAILGGMCTLIGTSTNLIVNGLIIEHTETYLPLFEIAKLGVPAALVGLAYMLIFGRKLLPSVDKQDLAISDPREYTLEMVVIPESRLSGLSIQQAGLRNLPGVYLMEIHRQGQIITGFGPQQRLQGGDQLIFVGMVDAIIDLQKISGLRPATRQVFKLNAPRRQRVFAEAVVSRTSPLVGMTIKEGRFRSKYEAVVLAVCRNGERINKRIGDIILEPGDALFLETVPSFTQSQRNSSDFYLVNMIDHGAPIIAEKAKLALFILGLVVLTVTIGLLTMLQGALLGAGLMLITGCCTEEAGRRNLDLPLLIAIAASLALGRALSYTGAAEHIANLVLSKGVSSPLMALAIIYGMTALLSEFVTNNAAAVIVFPFAMATASKLGVSHMPFVMALMIAASASFITPLGYQTNLMVYGAGGYRYSDFMRFGTPLSLLIFIVTVFLAPAIWPF